jgi:hypothetical protein
MTFHLARGLNLTAIQLMHSPSLADVLTIIAYVLALSDFKLYDPTQFRAAGSIIQVIMVCSHFAVGDHVEIWSPYSQYDGIHGTVIKLMPKHITVALNLDSNIPLDHREWTYVLPKHLQLLDPKSLSKESDTYLYGNSDYDPKPHFDSASESLSDYPHARDFYSALLLLGVLFFETSKNLLDDILEMSTITLSTPNKGG